jgi:hypothetical protein
VREVRFELTRDGVPLLVYSLVPGVFTGQVSPPELKVHKTPE